METQTEFSGGNNSGNVLIATAKEYPDIIKELGDKLAGLSSVDAHYLSRYLRDEYQIEAPESANQNVEVIIVDTTPPEPTTFDVVLAGLIDPTKKIGIIKIIREMIGLGLAESKAFVDEALVKPKVIKESQSKEDADKMKTTLEAAGAKVELL